MSKKLFSRKETRNIAIEFAKYLMTIDMIKSSCNGDTVHYHPMEFELMHGELNVHGKQIFDSFVDTFEE